MVTAFAFACLLGQVDPPKQEEVNRTIDRGVNYLLSRVIYPTVPLHHKRKYKYDGLVLYTLMHANPMLKKDRRCRMIADRVAAGCIGLTYNASLAAMALEAYDVGTYRGTIFMCGQFLVDTQCSNGQWTYGGLWDPKKFDIPKDSGGTVARMRMTRSRKAPSPPPGDNSNTQYAALGLYAASRAGADLDRGVISRAIGWWQRSMNSDGSWGYCDKGQIGGAGFGSMTAGGASSILMLRRINRQSASASSISKPLKWLDKHFSVVDHPCSPKDRLRFHYYYLYALERTGDLARLEKIGDHAWYAEGARWLIENQRPSGSWVGEWMDGKARKFSPFEIADTCFAILFLERVFRVATKVLKKEKK